MTDFWVMCLIKQIKTGFINVFFLNLFFFFKFYMYFPVILAQMKGFFFGANEKWLMAQMKYFFWHKWNANLHKSKAPIIIIILFIPLLLNGFSLWNSESFLLPKNTDSNTSSILVNDDFFSSASTVWRSKTNTNMNPNRTSIIKY